MSDFLVLKSYSLNHNIKDDFKGISYARIRCEVENIPYVVELLFETIFKHHKNNTPLPLKVLKNGKIDVIGYIKLDDVREIYNSCF